MDILPGTQATEADDGASVQLDAPVDGVATPTLPNASDGSHEAPGTHGAGHGLGQHAGSRPRPTSATASTRNDLRQVTLPVVANNPCQGVFDGVPQPGALPEGDASAPARDGRHDALAPGTVAARS